MSDQFSLRTSQILSESSNLSSINNAMDLLNALRKFPNAGDRIELFFALAENHPEVAFRSFITILKNNAYQTLRALALRSLGKIKDASIRKEIIACQSQPSQELLRLLAEEANGRSPYSNDLTQWAALETIIALGYDPFSHLHHTALGALVESPGRISNEIAHIKLEQQNKFTQNNRYISKSKNELTPDYERYLEFWVYGPTELLFSSIFDDDIIKNILYGLGIRGLAIAFNTSSERSVQIQAYYFSKKIFKNYKKPLISESLKRFLKPEYQNDNSLEVLSKAITFDLENQINFDLRTCNIGKLREIKTNLEKYETETSSLFETATKACRYSVLNDFLRSECSEYLTGSSEMYLDLFDRSATPKIHTQLAEVTSAIAELEKKPGKIIANYHLFNQLFDLVKNIDSQLYTEINKRSNQDYHKKIKQLVALDEKVKNEITLVECEQFLSDLNARKNNLGACCYIRITEIGKSINAKKFKFTAHKDLGCILSTIVVIIMIAFWYISLIIVALFLGHSLSNHVESEKLKKKLEKIKEIQNTLNSSWQQ